ARIIGLGFHVPERVIANRDLEALMETSDEWIVERTGIRERRFVAEGTGTAALAVEAARKALADAGRQPADVDLVLVATISSDWLFPGVAPMVQDQLGLGTIAVMDIRNACSGFLYAIGTADAFIRAGS